MKISARNQFPGTVSRITAGAVNDEVELTLSGGHKIVAIVTHESANALALAQGVPAIALVKASSILVATELGNARLSARNVMVGKVSAVHPGAVNAEVVIDVGSGHAVAAIVTMESIKSLGLQPGAEAAAVIKASSVIIATQA